jgi:pimeloyl-ACP methyl ester carboxylesterase
MAKAVVNHEPTVAKKPPLPAGRRWAIRAGFALLLLGPTLVGVLAARGPTWMAHGIAIAPNAGRTFRVADDPPPSALHELGVDEQLRVDAVGACKRSVSLSVWVIEPKAEPLGTVLLFHGIRSDKSWLKGLATQVARQGYRAVLPDLPGHGRSSGDWLTYGACEASEMKALLDELTKRDRVSGNVGVIGLSYGAALGIQLAAVDPRVTAAVAIAPFSSLREVVPGYVTRYLPVLGQLVPASVVQHAVDQAGKLGSFSPDSASPLLAVARTQAQILLIHGLADAHIGSSHSRALHAAAPTHTELILLENDDHFSIASDHSRALETRGIPWLHRWLDPPHATRF